METLFYLTVASLFIYELFKLLLSDRINGAFRVYKSKCKDAKLAGRRLKYDEIGGSLVFMQIIEIFYLLFVIVGLMSSQWIPFLLLFLLSWIPKNWLWYRRLDGIVSLILLAFIMLNKYQFHIDLFNSIKTLLW